MSTSLYWKPIPKKPKDYSIYSLKFALAKKLGSYDGSVSEKLGTVDISFIPFLEGIVASNDKEMSSDAQKLIDAINLYGVVELSIY